MANFALASYLARAGVAVHLVAHRASPELLETPGVTLHRVPKPAGSYLAGSPLLDRAGRALARRLTPAGARVIVNGGNCLWGDVNWVHYVHAAYVPSVKTGAMRRLKERVARAYFTSSERRALAEARLVIANSLRTKRDLVERLGVDDAKVHHIYYGIDATRFGLIEDGERLAARARLGWSPDRPVVSFIGALGDRRKGFDVLFDAWRTLCADPSWDVDLCIVGTGAEVPLWEERARQAGLAERMRFMGFSREVERLLAASDALVHPARYEAYGLGVHEALSRGLPALVSAQAGVAERYPGHLRPLLITDPEQEEAVRRALLWWRANDRRVAADLRPFSEELRAANWDSMASAMWSVIEGRRPPMR